MKTAKLALITGGSRGLGRDMALNLAKEGKDVVFTYHSDEQKALATAKEIEELGQRAYVFQLDTRDVKQFDGFIAQLMQRLQEDGREQKIDFLINNAGTALYAGFLDTTEEQIDEMFLIHYKAVFFLTQKLVPYLQDAGRIINISSGLARFSFPGSSGYASMKGAVEVLTRYLAKELGARKIAVNVVAPGAIETDFGGGRTRDDATINANIAAATALGRVGLPEDIGAIVAFLCSEGAGWINGQRIEVSGGMLL
ncbi:SDR family NAD(P)-dependent oxidoreductase [Sphingobacterium bambusae]|uniref:SDR family NAD(P)-dependent oxidoreductase n=1 Tax=Sphingobacterium bambusae TaxID=662858 RepID=A0ABW6BCC0_9SPHI|nr:SDR family oxidoreductase [Sphingobacterium bambusae]WPL48316.1 SDR family oxidoreductase [Sphingobacterium bambusae]